MTAALVTADRLAGVPPVAHEVGLDGLRLVVLPPGPVDLRITMGAHLVDLNMNAVRHDLAVNRDRRASGILPADSLALWPLHTEVSIRTVNTMPGCILEVDDAHMRDWAEGAALSRPPERYLPYEPDPIAADLGRIAIRYLTSNAARGHGADRLTVEALALAIGARAMRRAAFDGGGDPHPRALADPRLRRAVEWAESHLDRPSLAISDMARAAGISASRFGAAFRAAMGETPYAFVLRRRAERARDLILGTTLPLAQVADAAGFSSQAHMTTIVRRHIGTTPGRLRE